MKIGIFSECYDPVINGVVHSIHSTKKGLEELGHEVFIFTPNYRAKNIKSSEILPCSSISLGKSGYHLVLKIPDAAKKVAAGLDLYHTHHPFVMGQAALKLAEEFKKPICFTHHTQYSQYETYVPIFKGTFKKWLPGYMRKFCNRCTLIIAPSRGIKKVIEGYRSKTPIEVVPNGVEVERFWEKNLPKPKEFAGVSPEEKAIIYVGRVAYEKNVDFVVKSFAKVVKAEAAVKLIIVGGGPAFEEIKKMAADLGVSEKIIFTGPIPYEQIRNFYVYADFFVTASKTEVHPLVGLEAMASALPIVALSAIGYDDIVEDGKTGYLSQDNLDEYAEKVVKLLKDPELIKKMSAAAKTASKNYSIEAAAKNMLAAYQKAIALSEKSKVKS